MFIGRLCNGRFIFPPGIFEDGYGRGYGNLTDDQRGQTDALYQKFFDQTAQIRSQIWAKNGEPCFVPADRPARYREPMIL